MAAINPGKAVALVVAIVAGVLLWDTPVVYPLKLLVVLIHEAGHALAAKAVGGEVVSVSVNHLQGGLCKFRFNPTFLNQVITSSAGYLGSALAGAMLLFVTLKLQSGRLVLAVLAGFVLLVTVFWARDLFTIAMGLGMTAALGASARFLSSGTTQGIAFFIATFNGLYALFDVRDDLWSAARRSGTDAALLAEATHIPSIVWAVLWTLFAVALLGAAIWLGLRQRRSKDVTPQLQRTEIPLP